MVGTVLVTTERQRSLKRAMESFDRERMSKKGGRSQDGPLKSMGVNAGEKGNSSQAGIT